MKTIDNMNKRNRSVDFILGLLLMAIFSTSCLEDFLDKAPDSGLSEEEVFTNYENFKRFFQRVYYGNETNSSTACIKSHFPFNFHLWDQKMTAESLTDMVDMARIQNSQSFKKGESSSRLANLWGSYGNSRRVAASWAAIRVCCLTIANIDRVKDISETERYDFLAQAHFIRAFCHFELFRFYGSLPYIDKALTQDDEWDLPRLSAVEMIDRVVADYDKAIEFFQLAGKMRRDPAYGQGHLNDPDQDKPNGITAMAMKSRALLYAASPLNNLTNDRSLWERAAIASWRAIETAQQFGYVLLSADKYTNNFYGVKYTNEQIWGHSPGSLKYNNGKLETFLPQVFCDMGNASGQCPTENFVSRFETKDGYPLYTESERAIATAAGVFNQQNPYVNRDPRLDLIVIYNQKPLDGYEKASLYINEDGSRPANTLMPNIDGKHRTHTGYYECKRTGKLAKNSSVQTLLFTDPIIRLGELYLNYAEAANEAWGVNGSAPNATMTALQAVNAIRARIGMPDVLAKFTSDTDTFRPRIKNERAIELCFEGYHYYCDIRRWKDVPTIMNGRLEGIQAVKLTTPDPVNYPTGFRYTRVELSSDRQVAWKNGMYYVPFQQSELLKMKNYIPNEAW